MNIRYQSDEVIVVEVFQCDSRPRIMDGMSVGLTRGDQCDVIEKWVGEDWPDLVRQEDGSFLSLDQMLGRQVPMFEVVAKSGVMPSVIATLDSLDSGRCMGIVGMLLGMRSQVQKGGVGLGMSPEDIDRHNKMMDDLRLVNDRMTPFESVATMMYGKTLLDLVAKIEEVRREALGKCRKVAEFYNMLPTLLSADGQGGQLGCVAFAEYGLVGFGRKP